MACMTSRPETALILTSLALLLAVPVLAQEKLLQLPIGDPARKDREAPLVLDAVTDTKTGDLITPDEMVKRLAGVRLLLIGEEHTSMEFHRVQARVVEALVAARRRVRIGLEMYPYTEQRFLDQWCDNRLTEQGFLRLSRWYENWGYHWLYYRDIFLSARDRRVPMFAVNTPREVVSAIRKKGLANLTPEEAAHIPKEIDVDSADYMTFFKASFEDAEGPVHGSGMPDEMWKNMLSAQATWDATMGYNAVQSLRKDASSDSIMVVLVGSGHVAYDLGIERQARKWFDGPIATLIPVPVTNRKTGPVRSVRASYADFIWGVPEEIDSLYPTLGISMAVGRGDAARQVIMLQKGSVADQAGFRTGDILVSMDGALLPDKETYNRLIAGKRWGDTAEFVVRRGTDTVTLKAVFRRKLG
jgi:uncharacterized iron-regulated protein